MHNRKSVRHQRAANARWSRADAEREADIEDRADFADARLPFDLDLRCVGGKHWHFEPRLGYHSWRRIDTETGIVDRCAALKTLLRETADDLPRMMAPRYSARHQ